MTAPTVPFEKAARDATGGNPKVQRRHYLNIGALPIIDQGQTDIAGYTDDADASYRGPLPVVLFGDHTRTLKYVDHPFALGADGVKALVPREGFDAKFLYYYWLSCDIPSHVYSRNFKFLKDLPVSVFAPSEQRRIVETLDQADALRKLRRNADAKAARILPALFLKMFGDPATNPMGWSTREVGKLGHVATGRTPPTKDDGMFDGDIPFATPSDLDNGLATTIRTVTQQGATFSKTVRAGSALVGCIGNVGKMAKTPTRTAFNQQINAVEWNEDVNDDFGIAALRFVIPRMQALATSTTLPILNKSAFSSIRIIVPPPVLQENFARAAQGTKQVLRSINTVSEKLDSLFGVLLDRAFAGQLTAKWRHANMQDHLVEMHEQTRLLNLPMPDVTTACEDGSEPRGDL
jgi:type I restriction enzyme S subunit